MHAEDQHKSDEDGQEHRQLGTHAGKEGDAVLDRTEHH